MSVTGWSEASWSTGRVDTRDNGLGAYMRAASAAGFYASLLGALSWADQDLVNAAYDSTAKKDTKAYAGVATVGYLVPVASAMALDVRTFVGYGTFDGDNFTDSAGITVSGTDDGLLTVGGTLGLHAALTRAVEGFVRGGIKWSDLDSSITAFGVTATGSVDQTVGTAEVGLVMRSAEGARLGVSGFGDFGDGTTSYGGRIHAGVRF